jgi:hypothetical protein
MATTGHIVKPISVETIALIIAYAAIMMMVMAVGPDKVGCDNEFATPRK